MAAKSFRDAFLSRDIVAIGCSSDQPEDLTAKKMRFFSQQEKGLNMQPEQQQLNFNHSMFNNVHLK